MSHIQHRWVCIYTYWRNYTNLKQTQFPIQVKWKAKALKWEIFCLRIPMLSFKVFGEQKSRFEVFRLQKCELVVSRNRIEIMSASCPVECCEIVCSQYVELQSIRWYRYFFKKKKKTKYSFLLSRVVKPSRSSSLTARYRFNCPGIVSHKHDVVFFGPFGLLRGSAASVCA